MGITVRAVLEAFRRRRRVPRPEPPFAPHKLERIRASLERQGVTFVLGEDGERLARALGAEALYFYATDEPGRPGVLVFGPNPSRTAVIEELIHLGQHRRAQWRSQNDLRFTLEIEAQTKLLFLGRRKGWTRAEMARIRRARREWIARSKREDGELN